MCRDGEEPLPAAVVAALRQRQARLQPIANNPGFNPLVASSEFFRGLTEATLQILEFLAQPCGTFEDLGVPAKQILEYLVNHAPESHTARFAHAVDAIEAFARNPAAALGRATPGAAAMVLGARIQFAREATVAADELVALNATANQMASLEAGALRAARSPRAPRSPVPDVEPPPVSGGTGTRPPGVPDPGLPPRTTPVYRDPIDLPPTCFFNQCLRNAIQVARWRSTGQWAPPRFRGYEYVEELYDLPASTPQVTRELRAAFGGERAVDPLHGGDGLQQHALGNPVVSSRAQIEAVMRELREHGNGIVLVEKTWVTERGIQRANHVFNVWGTPDGRMLDYDLAMGGPAHPLEWAHAQRIYFFRVP